MTFRYVEYNESSSVPNVVVDGSPNAATVLTLTHWPGIEQPVGLGADLSAQMVFEFLRTGREVDADVVTNNHFDQDGLVAMFALVDPESALRHEELLVDVAAAGDFGTYRFRQSARASMAIAALADAERSPIGFRLVGPYEQQCAVLYERCLEMLVPLVTDPDRFVDLWSQEDAALAASEIAIADGAVAIDEHLDVDLAIVDVADDGSSQRGHRFASETHLGVHPMAIHNATGCLRILEVGGGRYVYTDRYESWVQYRTRRPPARVDLRPLAEALSEADSATTWTASAPSALTPELSTDEQSSLERSMVVECLIEHLRTSPPAWDPYAVDRTTPR